MSEGDRDPLTGMRTSPDDVYWSTGDDGTDLGSYGTQWEADNAKEVYDKEQQATRDPLPDPDPIGFQDSPPPRGGNDRYVTKATSSHPFRKILLVILIVVIIIIVGIVLLSLLGDYAANHINSHA
jgi:hypothetical protein